MLNSWYKGTTTSILSFTTTEQKRENNLTIDDKNMSNLSIKIVQKKNNDIEQLNFNQHQLIEPNIVAQDMASKPMQICEILNNQTTLATLVQHNNVPSLTTENNQETDAFQIEQTSSNLTASSTKLTRSFGKFKLIIYI